MVQGGTVFLKCALDEVQSAGTAVKTSKDLNGKVSTNSLSCGASCLRPKENSAANKKKANVTDSAGGAVAGMMDGGGGENLESPIDYNRYCFYNCRPYDFAVGNICVGLDRKMKKAVQGEVDPALHPQVTDPKLQKAWAEATGASPAPTEPPTTTTASLPCAESDPCAYKLMNASIQDAKIHYAKAKEQSVKAAGVASMTG